jgi:hypothetical protein
MDALLDPYAAACYDEVPLEKWWHGRSPSSVPVSTGPVEINGLRRNRKNARTVSSGPKTC